MNQINEHLDRHPAPAPDQQETLERVEIKSKWFNLKIDDVNTPVLILIAMILVATVSVVWIIANS